MKIILGTSFILLHLFLYNNCNIVYEVLKLNKVTDLFSKVIIIIHFSKNTYIDIYIYICIDIYLYSYIILLGHFFIGTVKNFRNMDMKKCENWRIQKKFSPKIIKCGKSLFTIAWQVRDIFLEKKANMLNY